MLIVQRKGEQVPAKRQHSPKTLKPTIIVCSCAPVGASRKRMSRASLQDHAPIMHLVISEVDSPKSDVWTVLIDHPKDLGRGTGCTIPKEEVRVSRKHCCIAKVSKSAHLSCLKRLWVLHKASGQLSEHPPGTKLLLSPGDRFYLAKAEGVPKYGFEVAEVSQQDLENHRANKPPSTPQKRKRLLNNEPMVPSAPPKKAAKGMTPRDGLKVSLTTSAGKSAPEAPKFLSGAHFCFWDRRHLKRAMELLQCAGGIIDAEVGPETQYIVAAREMTAKDVGEKLGLDPEVDPWPEGKHLVDSRFVSSCIQARKLLDPTNFLVYCGMRDKAKDISRQAASKQPPYAELTTTKAASELPSQQRMEEPTQLPDTPVTSIKPPYKLDRWTGGDSGVPWGSDDCWLEPWTLASAQATLEKLIAHWHREPVRAQKEEEGLTPRASGSSDKEDLGSSLQLPDKCPHMACSKSATCIISHLKTLSENYDRAGIDAFRRRAAENGMRKLKQHHKALQSREDVEELHLGKETTEKITEIVETGQLTRNRMIQADSKAQTILMFAKVWGAAHKTAMRWYEDGCRTLDDVRKRDDLTVQQLAGLKHFADLQEKMTAQEGSELAEFVKQQVLKLFDWKVVGEDAAHVRQMGSYLRGKQRCSDVDMLLLPPASDIRTPSQLLQTLLSHLKEINFLTTDMQPEVRDKGDEHSASFLGFCQAQGSSCVRRIDIKIYPRRFLPFAVNYFTGSGPFNRALRFWANTAGPVVAKAQQIAPQATGLKLSDTSLVARAKRGYGKDRVEEVMGQPIEGITCETDIFAMLGLSYVPPHMRMSGDLE